jgi:hypothetical protein
MRRISTATILVAALATGSAWAQEEASPYRTAFSATGGLSVGPAAGFRFPFLNHEFGGHDSQSGFAIGGGIAHDLTPRLTVEASGMYLDRNASAWSADAGFRLNVLPSGRSIVPYFAASGGVFSERTSAADVRGVLDEVGRILPRWLPAAKEYVPIVDGLLPSARQTNAMVTLGGGTIFAAGPHVFVRPDARAQMVFSGGTRVLGLFTVNFGYRF